MRHHMLVASALTLGLVAAACSQQQPPASSEQGPISVGRTAPAFSLKSASGGTVSLSDFSGKPVLLYFSMGPG